MVERTNRPKRIPLGTRNILTAPERPGYVRRFVNDEGDRIKHFEAAGYSVVREDIDVGDPKAGKDTKTGSVVSPAVGGGKRAVLMEIKKEWYDEDQKAKQDRISEGEADMKRQLNSRRDGQYGGVTIT
jgi:hypothetical protein